MTGADLLLGGGGAAKPGERCRHGARIGSVAGSADLAGGAVDLVRLAEPPGVERFAGELGLVDGGGFTGGGTTTGRRAEENCEILSVSDAADGYPVSVTAS